MKKATSIFLLGLSLLIAGGASFAGYLWYDFSHSHGQSEKIDLTYEVKPGVNFHLISRELQDRRLVKNADFFWLYARILGMIGKVKMGEYALNTQMTPKEILAILISGKSIDRAFTVAEGLNIFEIAKLYELQGFGTAQEFVSICRDHNFIKEVLGDKIEIIPKSLEGYLFPETYRLTKFTSTRALISQMVHNFQKVFGELFSGDLPSGLTAHQVVTLASIVEKETGAPEERPLIASVFLNRLQKNMRLQTDPTVIYAKALESGIVEQNISKVDLAMEHEYNTYIIFGLPPGPISNPGKEALSAIQAPAKSEYLYFVSQNNGTHIFSVDYKNHEKAVQEYQVKKTHREGHSWRELRSDTK